MKALLFRYSFPRFALATVLGKIHPSGYLNRWGPLALVDIPEPVFPAGDWVRVRTQLCGICGSDSKQVFLNGNFDNPLTALISFPQVLGHEAVGVVSETGPEVNDLQVGDRVVLNPWLPCACRGIDPPCQACQEGRYFACEHFTDGALPPGMHIGNNRGVSGGYAPAFMAHQSQLFRIPEGVSFEDAVLTDPTAVSLHAVLKAPPTEPGLVVVYGCGTLGLITVALLQALYPQVEVLVISRYPHQENLAKRLGAHHTLQTSQPLEIIETVAGLVGGEIHSPWNGLPMLLRGAQRIYDTVGSPQSLEVEVRIAQPQAKISISGVANPARFEWTPLYFKEIGVIGSNSFGMELVEGKSLHTFEIVLALMKEKLLDLSDLITHRFRLEDYRQAFMVTHSKGRSQSVKVVFDYEQ